MHIRPYDLPDLEPLMALWERSVRATHDFLASSDQAYRLRTIGEFAGAWFEKKGVRTDMLKV